MAKHADSKRFLGTKAEKKAARKAHYQSRKARKCARGAAW